MSDPFNRTLTSAGIGGNLLLAVAAAVEVQPLWLTVVGLLCATLTPVLATAGRDAVAGWLKSRQQAELVRVLATAGEDFAHAARLAAERRLKELQPARPTPPVTRPINDHITDGPVS